MILDLHGVNSDPFVDKEFDVCICGAGVAGITLALKLSHRLKVVLLEAGEYEYSADSQAIYKGENVGRAYFDLATTRLRYFGGSSNHWGGGCRPLDSVDFKLKPYVEFSGWPIDRDDLAPYFDETNSILDIREKKPVAQIAPLGDPWHTLGESQDFNNNELLQSAPTRFGHKYRNELDRMPNLVCYLNANVVDITLTENLSRVAQIEVRTYDGGGFAVSARVFVLTAGGLENPRILLNCNGQIPEGLGNQAGLVGRFFTEHPHHTVGTFVLQDTVKENLARSWVNDREARRFFTPSRELMYQEQILNFSIRLRPLPPLNDSSFNEQLRRIICGSELATSAVEKLQGRAIRCGPDDGLLGIMSEQAPNPLSRITLGTEFDRFEKRRIVLDWRLAEIDSRTIHRAVVRFGMTFASLELGRVRLADWLLSDDAEIELPGLEKNMGGLGGNHHMCTTRMGTSPRDGVVDSNQRVFGIDNLYAAGSSVFSTGGHAHPTFTIVQMTLRLASHLNETLEKQFQ